MKKIIFIITLSFVSLSAFSQIINIKGFVRDAHTELPVKNAVVLSGERAASCDETGAFEIQSLEGGKLIVKCLGYETKTYIVDKTSQSIIISLQFSTTPLNGIEITESSIQNKSALYQPSAITKLSTTEINRGTGLYLDDAINANIPGVTMQRRAVSSGQQLNIRGYGNGIGFRLNSNFDTQGAKVYLNGIPITDAEGITLMDDIDFGSIGSVEVVKGPSGTLYGLAIAGVVNLKTITPEKGKSSIAQEVLIGDYNTKRFTTTRQISEDNFSLLVNYGHQTSDGYLVHSESHKDFINLAGEFKVNDKQIIHNYFGYSNSYDQRSGELTLTQYANFDYSGNPEYIKRNAHSEIISFRAGVGHTYKFNENISNNLILFGSGVSNNSSSAAGWTDKDPINYGFRTTFDTKFDLKNGLTLSGVTGAEAQKQNTQTIGYGMVPNPADSTAYWIIGGIRSNQQTTTSTTSLFSEWTLVFPKGFSITAGLGWSNMNIALQDKLYSAVNKNPTFYSTAYDGLFSPHVALNKVFNKQFSVYATFNRGYKAPVSSNFFIPATGQLNLGLKPEVGDQFEIGTKGSWLNDKLSYQLSLFATKFTDKMTFIAVPLNGSTTTTAYTYVANAGNQNDNGIEFLVKYTAYQSNTGFLKSVSPFFNFAYSDFKYDGYSVQALSSDKKTVVATDYSGKAVAGVSPVTANLGIDFMTQIGLYANAVYSYKDAFPITSDGLNKTSAYSLFNAKVGYRTSLSDHFDLNLYGGVNNISGTQYANMVFINQLPDVYLPAPYKAVFFGGVSVKYNF